MAKEELIYEINVTANNVEQVLGKILGDVNKVTQGFQNAAGAADDFTKLGKDGSLGKGVAELKKQEKVLETLPEQYRAVSQAIDILSQKMNRLKEQNSDVSSVKKQIEAARALQLSIAQEMQKVYTEGDWSKVLKQHEKEQAEMQKRIATGFVQERMVAEKEAQADALRQTKGIVAEKFAAEKEAQADANRTISNQVKERFAQEKEAQADANRTMTLQVQERFQQEKEIRADAARTIKNQVKEQFEQEKEARADGERTIANQIKERFAEEKEARADATRAIANQVKEQFAEEKEARADAARTISNQVKEKFAQEKEAQADAQRTLVNQVKERFAEEKEARKDASRAIANQVKEQFAEEKEARADALRTIKLQVAERFEQEKQAQENQKRTIRLQVEERMEIEKAQKAYDDLAEARVKRVAVGNIGPLAGWQKETEAMEREFQRLNALMGGNATRHSIHEMSYMAAQKEAEGNKLVENAVAKLAEIRVKETKAMIAGETSKINALEKEADAQRAVLAVYKDKLTSDVNVSTPYQGQRFDTKTEATTAVVVKQEESVKKNVNAWKSYSQQLGDSRKSIEQLYHTYQRNPEAKTLGAFQRQILALKQTSKEYETFQKTISHTGTVYDWFADRVLHHLTWLSSGLALGAAMAIPHEAIESIKELEYGLAGVRQVMTSIEHGGPAAQQELESLVGIASRYGVEIKEVMEAAKSIGRMYGKGEEGMLNTNLVTEQAAKMAVADAFDVETAYRGLESALSQFNLQTENSAELMTNTNRIIDVWTRTSHSGAASAADIGHAIEAAGTAAAQAGMSFEYFNALVAAGVRATARSGSEIGQAIKSMMVSLQTAKSQKELAKWGITLTQVGDDGAKHMRNIEDVILDIAKLVTTTDKDTSKLLQTLSGGKYQYSKISAILRNYQEIYRVLGQINDAETVGFTDKQAQIQLETYQRQLQQLKSDLQGLFTDIGNAGLLDALKGAVKLVDNLIVGMRQLKGVNGGLVSVAAGFTSVYVAMKGISKAIDFAMLIRETYNMALASQYAGKTEESAALAVTRARAAQRLVNQGVILSEENVAKAAIASAEATNVDTAATERNIIEHQKQQAALAGGTREVGKFGAGLAAVGGPISVLTITLMGLGAAYAYVAREAGEAARKQREQAETSAKQISSETQRLNQMQENLKDLESLVKQYNAAVEAEANFTGDPESKENERLIQQKEYIRHQLENEFGKWNVTDAMKDGLIDLEVLKADYFADFAPQIKKVQDANLEGYKKAVELEKQLTANKEEQLRIQEKIKSLTENTNDDFLIYEVTGGLSQSDTVKSLRDKLDNLQKEEVETNNQLNLLRQEGRASNEAIKNVNPNNTQRPLGGTIDDEPSEKELKKLQREQAKLESAEAKEWKGELKAIENKANAELNEINRLSEMYGMTVSLAQRQRQVFQELIAGYARMEASAPEGITHGSGIVGNNPGVSVVQRASQYEGIPYVYGGNDVEVDEQNNVIRGALDCSSFVQRVYGDLNVDVPRTADDQQEFFAGKGAFVEADDVEASKKTRAGDLVWMPGDGVEYGHVGIADGRGNMWINDSSTGVHNTPIEGRNINGYGSLSTLVGYAAGDGSADESLALKSTKATNNMIKQYQDSMFKALQDEIKAYQSEAKRTILDLGGGASDAVKEGINLNALKKEIDATVETLNSSLDKQTIKYRDTLDALKQKQRDYETRKAKNDLALGTSNIEGKLANIDRDTAEKLNANRSRHPFVEEGRENEAKVQRKAAYEKIELLKEELRLNERAMELQREKDKADMASLEANIAQTRVLIEAKRKQHEAESEGSSEWKQTASEIDDADRKLTSFTEAYNVLKEIGSQDLRALQDAHKGITDEISENTRNLKNLQDKYALAIEQSAADMFTGIIVKGNNFKESMKNLLQEIASMWLKSQLIKAFMSLGSLGGKPSASATNSYDMTEGGGFFNLPSIFAKGGSLKGYADGGATGYISGAGTGKSDDILAYLADKDRFVYLSNGEYVLNAKATKQLGKATLDKLNGYADGGALNPVPYVPSISSDVQDRTLSQPNGNAYTEQLLAEQNEEMRNQTNLMKQSNQGGNGDIVVLNTHASSDDVLRAMKENPRAIQAILGRQNRMGFR